MKRPMDHQPPRRELGDVRGADKGERLSEYFDFERFPEKAERKVLRKELLAWLMRQEKIRQDRAWYRRLWRWLKARRGSGPQVVGGGVDAAS